MNIIANYCLKSMIISSFAITTFSHLYLTGALGDGSIADPTKTTPADDAAHLLVRHQVLYL